ncbi:Chromosome segregation ATPase [Giardia duodenalis]|uniref:Chromosome segregation ATPase n=1 Tax=Giardia intestinalis TaxID=5741 RepID=V6TUK1_GIAIN|nr:Chromosome segregation ATPase [Giardia intestinalis]
MYKYNLETSGIALSHSVPSFKLLAQGHGDRVQQSTPGFYKLPSTLGGPAFSLSSRTKMKYY